MNPRNYRRQFLTIMHLPSCRQFLKASLALACLVAGNASGADAPPVPTLHVTDLFRPHNDPDDHWDLATQYALALQGKLDLRGVMIDFPQPKRKTPRTSARWPR